MIPERIPEQAAALVPDERPATRQDPPAAAPRRVQRLVVGAADDALEHEADATADAVVASLFGQALRGPLATGSANDDRRAPPPAASAGRRRRAVVRRVRGARRARRPHPPDAGTAPAGRRAGGRRGRSKLGGRIRSCRRPRSAAGRADARPDGVGVRRRPRWRADPHGRGVGRSQPGARCAGVHPRQRHPPRCGRARSLLRRRHAVAGPRADPHRAAEWAAWAGRRPRPPSRRSCRLDRQGRQAARQRRPHQAQRGVQGAAGQARRVPRPRATGSGRRTPHPLS